MKSFFRFGDRHFARLGACISLMALLLATGCAGVAPNYHGTNSNVMILQSYPGKQLAPGEFKAVNDNLNQLSIRGGSYTSPYKDSYAEYLREALQQELQNAGRLDPNSAFRVSGELLENSVNSAIPTANARVSARFIVAQGKSSIYDKILVADAEWESSVLGPIAIPAAREHYVATVSTLLGKLFSDPDFQRVTR